MFGKKSIPKIVSIFGKKIFLKVVLDIVTIIYPTLLFGKKFILKCVQIFGKKFLLKALLHIVTIKYPFFLGGGEIYSDNCTNMWGEYSSEKCT